MNKQLVAATALALSAIASPAVAETAEWSGPYVGVYAGMNANETDVAELMATGALPPVSAATASRLVAPSVTTCRSMTALSLALKVTSEPERSRRSLSLRPITSPTAIQLPGDPVQSRQRALGRRALTGCLGDRKIVGGNSEFCLSFLHLCNPYG